MRTVRGIAVCLVLVALGMGFLEAALAADGPRVAPVLDRILAKKELVVGTAADMPPLNMTLKDGKIAGMEVDIATLMANEIGVRLTLKPMPFNDLLPALEAGQVDLILSGMTMTPLRNTRVAFAGPYFGSGKSVLIKQENVASLQSTEMMNNPDVTVAALKGSTSQRFVERLAPKAKLVLTDGYDQAIAMVLDGTVQAMVADFPICNVSVYRHQGKGLTTLKSPLNYEPIGMALSPNDPLFLNMVQNFVAYLLNSGDLSLLRQKWFEDASWVPQLR
ncbi:MAG TPA: transporter substrate-binding domain-containing protein [Candidatus Methylomirabilis sp.]|nr:transporter substrate-binding domain-containing protein [Candidatus Methylomirabilis sp.]